MQHINVNQVGKVCKILARSSELPSDLTGRGLRAIKSSKSCVNVSSLLSALHPNL